MDVLAWNSNVLSNYIFVTDQDNRRIKVLDKFTKSLVKVITLGEEVDATDVVVEGSFLFISDNFANCIQVMNLETCEFVRSIGVYGSGPGQLNHPVCVTTYSPDMTGPHFLLVSEYRNKRVSVFDAMSGEYMRSFGSDPLVPMDVIVWTPSGGGCIDAQVFVCDFLNHRIAVFNFVSGSLERTVGRGNGSEPGQFNLPSGIAIHQPPGSSDDEALLLVADFCNHRVQVFGLVSGEVLRVIGERGSADGQFTCCSQLAINVLQFDGRERQAELIVSDTENHRLQVFDLYSGDHVMTVGSGRGPGADEFDIPKGLFICEEREEDAGYVMK